MLFSSEENYKGWVSQGYSPFHRELELETPVTLKDDVKTLNRDLDYVIQAFLFDMFTIDEAIELFPKYKDALEKIRSYCKKDFLSKYLNIAGENIFQKGIYVADLYKEYIENYVTSIEVEYIDNYWISRGNRFSSLSRKEKRENEATVAEYIESIKNRNRTDNDLRDLERETEKQSFCRIEEVYNVDKHGNFYKLDFEFFNFFISKTDNILDKTFYIQIEDKFLIKKERSDYSFMKIWGVAPAKKIQEGIYIPSKDGKSVKI